MGKIVMDALELGSFVREVVFNLPFLKRYAENKHSYDRAMYYANNINLGPIDRALDVVIVTQGEIITEFGKSIPNVTPTMYYSNIIWEYVYILLYYSHYGEELWVNTILPKMWTMQRNAIIRDEMKNGEEYVTQYIKARQALKEKISAKTPPPEEIPDIVQTMQDINSGKIRYNQVDWEAQIKEVLRLCTYMSHNYPHILWLWYFINHIDEPTKRMDVLCKIRDAAPKCFDDVFEARDFQEDCQCLYRICCNVRELKLQNKVKIVHTWNDADRKSLNDLAFILNDDCVDANFMVALAEEIYRSGHAGENPDLLESVLRCNRYVGQLSMNNIVDFSKALYVAEGYRQCILSGNSDYNEFPNLKNFKRQLRNACFDVYIELRAEQIKSKMAEDNEIVDDPDDIEYYFILQKEEEEVAKREISFEQFRGSRAYNALWYEGKEDVLKMTNMFIQHLPNYIAKKQSELSSQAVNSLQLPANANQVIIQTKEVNIKDNKGTIISDSDVSVYTK